MVYVAHALQLYIHYRIHRQFHLEKQQREHKYLEICNYIDVKQQTSKHTHAPKPDRHNHKYILAIFECFPPRQLSPRQPAIWLNTCSGRLIRSPHHLQPIRLPYALRNATIEQKKHII